MKYFLLVIVFILSAVSSFAQTAFDSACYYPERGIQNELDTIYGSTAYQHLGQNLRTFPPLKGQQYDQLAFMGAPGNTPFLTTFETHPSFDLHSLKISKKLNYQNIKGYRRGHYRSPHIIDLFYDGSQGGNARIYWADENGEFDSARSIRIIPLNGYGGGPADYMSAYSTYLTSDTVEDIVVSFVHTSGIEQDSIFIAFVRGGQQLYSNVEEAWWDEKVFWGIPEGVPTSRDSSSRALVQGDFRGIGRDDLVAVDIHGNYYYYRNDRPFSLENFARSLKYDTLMTSTDWSLYPERFDYSWGGGISMKAFPKQSWDKSQDLILMLPIEPSLDSYNDGGACIFKGGSEFGSKRLHFDSADFFLHCPGYYTSAFSGAHWNAWGSLGDLTGTGNPVLLTSGYKGIGSGFVALYVLGKAIDDKIDVYIPLESGGASDTIIADNSVVKRLIFGGPAYQTPKDYDKNKFEVGTIEILYGHEKIPIRLNPKYAVPILNEVNGELKLYPNPSSVFVNFSARFDKVEPIRLTIRDILGRSVWSEIRFASGGIEEFHIGLPLLPAGAYIFQAEGTINKFSGKLTIMR